MEGRIKSGNSVGGYSQVHTAGLNTAIVTVLFALMSSLFLVLVLMLALFGYYHRQPNPHDNRVDAPLPDAVSGIVYASPAELDGLRAVLQGASNAPDTAGAAAAGRRTNARDTFREQSTSMVFPSFLADTAPTPIVPPPAPVSRTGSVHADMLMRLALGSTADTVGDVDACQTIKDIVRKVAEGQGVSAASLSVESIRSAPGRDSTIVQFTAFLSGDLTPDRLLDAIAKAVRPFDAAASMEVVSDQRTLIRVAYRQIPCVELLCITPVPLAGRRTPPAPKHSRQPQTIVPTEAHEPAPVAPEPAAPVPEAPSAPDPVDMPVLEPDTDVTLEAATEPTPDPGAVQPYPIRVEPMPEPAHPEAPEAPDESEDDPAGLIDDPVADRPVIDDATAVPDPDVDETDPIHVAQPYYQEETRDYVDESLLIPVDDGRPIAYLAIIIDDGGYGGRETDRILEMDNRLTLAILPDTPFARETAERAAAKGFEIMLHMPMQAGNGRKNYFPGEIRVSMTREEIRLRTRECIDQFPEALGVNNHTGGLFTTNAEKMRWFLEVVQEEGMYFVDSRTIGSSRAYDVAIEMGIPCARRDLFLDHTSSVADIRRRFNELVAMAKRRGSAVGIGHFRPNTVRVLAEELPKLDALGIELVPASELVW